MLELLKRTNFLREGLLTRDEIDDLYDYAKYGQGGAVVLCNDERPSRVSSALKFLLDESKSLPDRFERFYTLKGAGIWTTSQILSKWRPKKYAFVAFGGSRAKPFMKDTLFDRMSPRQLETAREDVVIEYGIDPADYSLGTIKYLLLSKVLAEVKELLALEYYWEIQNILWHAWNAQQRRPYQDRLPRDRRRGHRSGRVPSTEAIGESDAKGMEIAKRFEREEGRTPDDIFSTRAVGYDIRSESERGDVRYIEVKTRFGSFPVGLTENQYRTAMDLGNKYYLYVITGDNEMRIISNPVAKCAIQAIPSVDYQVVDWKRKGKRVTV